MEIFMFALIASCNVDRQQKRLIAEPSALRQTTEPASISLRKLLHSFATAYRLCRERCRQRRQLLEMDDRQLKDIGITREQAEQEGRKPLWEG